MYEVTPNPLFNEPRSPRHPSPVRAANGMTLADRMQQTPTGPVVTVPSLASGQVKLHKSREIV